MTRHVPVWDGPKAGEMVLDVPMTVTPGHACAMRWMGPKGPRYAVYILLAKPDGSMGLVHERSYEKAFQAEQRVRHLTRAVEAARARALVQ